MRKPVALRAGNVTGAHHARAAARLVTKEGTNGIGGHGFPVSSTIQKNKTGVMDMFATRHTKSKYRIIYIRTKTAWCFDVLCF